MDDTRPHRSFFGRLFRFIFKWIIILLVFAAIIALIFPVSQNTVLPSNLSLKAGSAEFDGQFAQYTDSTVETGEQVTPIDSGQDFLPILISAINNASSTIDFTTYPWGNGTFSDQVFAALLGAAQRGVAVRVLLDAEGGHEIPASTIQSIEQAGGKVAKYDQFSLANPLQYDERDHMRAFVIDGKIGFFGGMGIDDHWLGTTTQKAWVDMMFEVKDTMAESIQNAFAVLWGQATGETLTGTTFYPPISTVTQPTNAFVPIIGLPGENSDPVANAFDITALSAQKTLLVVNPYFVPNQQFLTILEQKAQSGVDVELVLPGKNAPQALYLRLGWERYYEQLLQAGVKIYEYQPSMIHTKLITVDGTWSLLGSANIDNRSEEINAENMMGIDDPILAASLQQTVAGYESQSDPITLQQWQEQYGFFRKMLSDIILIFQKQY